MPSTTMRHASVMVFNGMSMAYMMPTEMNVLSGMVMAATMALLRGKRIIITSTMMAMEMTRSRRKS